MNLQDALRRHFGFSAFRSVQRDVIEHLLARKSALLMMPTGEGKSLCYQLPALLQEGLTIVVSPLIALMEDQVHALSAKGLPGTCIHSQLPRAERERRIGEVARGAVKLCYVTPERFRVPGFLDALAAVRVDLLAVDEAHCVSQWGHDFRPDYNNLGAVRAQLGDPPCLASTATATPAVQEDILRALRMTDARRFHTGIERKNLFLAVRETHDFEAKLTRLQELVTTLGGPGIVYFALIQELRRVEDALLRTGLRTLVYHGDLSASERKQEQQRFLQTSDALILATNAFGMGVDKPDIRFIAHWQIPRTLEAYYQEIGRAGRDGKGALCELLYLEEDVAIQRNFTEWANPERDLLRSVVQHLATAGETLHALDLDTLRATFLHKQKHDGRIETCLRLLRAAGCCEGELGRDFTWRRTPSEDEIAAWTPEDKRKRDLMGLLAMVRYARAATCRKREVHAYFGFESSVPCGACDACVSADEWLAEHVPHAARRALVSQEPAPGALARGDWVQVEGLGLCTVLRVHATPRGTTVDVETHEELERRSFDLGRVRWRRIARA